VVACQCQK